MHNTSTASGGAARAVCAVVCAASIVAGTAGCNRRVFTEVQQSCDSTIPVDLDIPLQKAADILIVVDNSGSMQEEQNRLKDNFFNLNFAADVDHPNVDADECPLKDLANIPTQYKNPAKSLYEGDGPLSRCGFIQLLAAFDNDYRVGVITTDVGLYDNRLPDGAAQLCVVDDANSGDGHCAAAGTACNCANKATCGAASQCENTWGFRPQRGCLQPDADPALVGTSPAVHKLISRQDLDAADDANDPDKKDFAKRFAATLDNIRTFGSPYERGLDAVTTFLDDGAARAPGCEDDLASFRRADAQLVVIFLSDEEDCSHSLSDNPPFDELVGEDPLPEAWDGFVTGGLSPDLCYQNESALPTAGVYAEKLKTFDAHAKIAVIAGLLPDDAAAGGFDAGGCRADDDVDVGVAGDCIPTEGKSNFATSCDAQGHYVGPGAQAGDLCCVADGNERYLDFSKDFVTNNNPDFLLDSICRDSFRTTMIQVAAFIAARDFVDLVEPPKDGAVVVTLKRPGDAAPKTVPSIDAASCASDSGWYLEGDRKIVFCGDAIPAPGDELKIRAKGQAETAACQAVE